MEPILGLVENSLRIGFKCLFVDLLAAVSRKTVHHEHVCFCKLHDLSIDLISRKLSESLRRFRFFAHGDPNVGIEQVCSFGCCLDILRADDLSSSTIQNGGMGL